LRDADDGRARGAELADVLARDFENARFDGIEGRRLGQVRSVSGWRRAMLA